MMRSRSLHSLVAALTSLAAPLAAPAASDYSVPFAFATVAGDSSIGSDDGPGKGARFHSPRGVAVDRDGHVYVADAVNNTIRKITPGGVVTTFGGTAGIFGAGMDPATRPPLDGTGPDAIFSNPEGIAVDVSGTIYVTDKMAFLVRKITPTGAVSTLAGSFGKVGDVDAVGAEARFHAASAAAVDAAGNVYVSEWGSHVIRKITPAGAVTTLAGKADQSGNSDGTGADARFFQPMGLALDRAGNLFVADAVNCAIRRVTPDGVVTTIAGKAGERGTADGPAATARFDRPCGLAFDSAGNLFIADSGNATLRRLTAAGTVSTIAGQAGVKGSADGSGSTARFQFPVSLAIDANDLIYVADASDNTIRKVTTAGLVTTLAGLGLEFSLGHHDGANARFDRLGTTAVGPAGEVYVADTLNATVRKIAPDGLVTTIAGTAGARGSQDGTGAAARFAQPYGLAVDAAGNVFVSDPGNDTVRRISPAGVVTTVAGKADAGPGFADGSGAEARFNYPFGIAVGTAGDLFVADTDNHVIRRIASTGEVTTIAGKPGTPGTEDGTGAAARFIEPAQLAVDSAGNILVADSGAHTIRRITFGGVVTTVAGVPGKAGSEDGTLAEARFSAPSGVGVDTTGAIFVADAGNHLVRRISPDGKVTTLGGLVRADGYANGLGVRSRFTSPPAVAVNAKKLYLTSGPTLRMGVPATSPVITTQPLDVSRTVGESAQFTVAASAVPAPVFQWYHGTTAIPGATTDKFAITAAQAADGGEYSVVVTNDLGSVTSSKATLTVTAAPPPPPPPPPPSGGSGGGGGAPSGWFVAVLGALWGAHTLRRRPADRCPVV